jgi:hypothetical protein
MSTTRARGLDDLARRSHAVPCRSEDPSLTATRSLGGHRRYRPAKIASLVAGRGDPAQMF